MNKINLSVVTVLFTVLMGTAGQASAQSAMQQLQDASKGTREAASVFDGSRMSR